MESAPRGDFFKGIFRYDAALPKTDRELAQSKGHVRKHPPHAVHSVWGDVTTLHIKSASLVYLLVIGSDD